jgi:transposase InsO family protein
MVIHIYDFIEGLPKSNQYSVIMVVVDRFTKYAHFIPVSHPYNVTKIANLFSQNVMKLHGLPNNIVSDRDPTFTIKFWRELFQIQGVKLLMSTTYHPQTDGQTEATNKTLEGYLRCYVGDNPKGWSNWLTMAEYCNNTSYHSSLKSTPFEATYGYPPPSLTDYIPGSTKNQTAEEHLQHRTEQIAEIKHNLAQA